MKTPLPSQTYLRLRKKVPLKALQVIFRLWGSRGMEAFVSEYLFSKERTR